MLHRCGDSGCFLDSAPRLVELASCLPGSCAFTDVDGLFERRERALFLEWKRWTRPRELDTGQHIALRNLSRLSGRIWIVIACGDPQTMGAHHFREVHGGLFTPWLACEPAHFKARLRYLGQMFNDDREPDELRERQSIGPLFD